MTEPTYQKVPQEEPQFEEVVKPVPFEYVSVEKQADAADTMPLEVTVAVQDTRGHFLLSCLGAFCCGVWGVLGTLLCCPSSRGKGGAATGCAILFFKTMIVLLVLIFCSYHYQGPDAYEVTGLDRDMCQALGARWVDKDHPHFFGTSRAGRALFDHGHHHGEHHHGDHHGRHHHGEHHHGHHHHHHGHHGANGPWNVTDPEAVVYVNSKLLAYLANNRDSKVVELFETPIEARLAFVKQQDKRFRRHVRKIVDFAAYRRSHPVTNEPGMMYTEEGMPRPDDDMQCECPFYYQSKVDESGRVFCKRAIAFLWVKLLAATMLFVGFVSLCVHYLKQGPAASVTVQPAEGIVVQA